MEDLSPRVDGGDHPVKRVVGDRVAVSCDLLCDGHDAVDGVLLHRAPSAPHWRREPLAALGNDRFGASFVVQELGTWEFAVEAWVDPLATWRSGTQKKLDAGLRVDVELLAGAHIFRAVAARAEGKDASVLADAAARLGDVSQPDALRLSAATEAATADAARRHPHWTDATRSHVHRIVVDPVRARFSAWYEMFPRSAGPPGQHGTLRDCARRLEYVASMGFDVLYLPPIHPIGRAFRKGPNNSLEAGPDDVGSPWAIGASEGGHKSVHPQLGTVDDLRALVQEARSMGIEVALDMALQASHDHPYMNEHPEWFKRRPDGSVQYAENPPKKYQDVYPFDFECEAWESLWRELLGIFVFWCDQGVRVFRVDNPHTKPLRFWEWCIAEVKARHPEAIFLAEAFTRPKIMYALAKLGFTQSYTYFAWRHSKREFIDYVNELTRPPVSEFYRPNFWPNTPDILPEHLQFGGRPAFVQRLVLAATLSSNYGIYGPAFELMEHVARPESEEYTDNEKYQLRAWSIDREDSLRDVVSLVNRIRQDTPALQHDLVAFHEIGDEQLLAFSKRSPGGESVVIVVVNLDIHHVHSGHLDLDMSALGLAADEDFQVHDVLADVRHRWHGPRPYVELDPKVMPASIFVVRRKVRTEHDFDYFL